MSRQLPAVSALVLACALAGCSKPAAEESAPPADPVEAEALGGPLMTDPDLVSRNPAHAALGGGGPATAPIPALDRGAETIAAARAEAAKLVGGPIGHAPPPQPSAGAGASLTPELTANRALADTGSATDCVRRLDYTMAWAARMPEALPVYPRGHVQEAAGADEEGCRLRVVNFLSPVPLADLVDFYWTRARAAWFAPVHRMQGGDHAISGGKGTGTFVAYLREREGLTEVDLVTNGL